MPILFPINPVNGQIFQAPNGYTYVYRTETDSWVGTTPLTNSVDPIAGPPGLTGYTGSQGIIGYTGSTGTLSHLMGSNIIVTPTDFSGVIPESNKFSSTEFLNITPTKRIELSIYNLKITDREGLLIQFGGTNTGYINERSKYLSSSSWINGITGNIRSIFDSTGFYISLNSSTVYINLIATFTKVGDNYWVGSHHGTATSGLGVSQPLVNYFNIVGGGSIDMAEITIGKMRVICRSAAQLCSEVPGKIVTGACKISYD